MDRLMCDSVCLSLCISTLEDPMKQWGVDRNQTTLDYQAVFPLVSQADNRINLKHVILSQSHLTLFITEELDVFEYNYFFL